MALRLLIFSPLNVLEESLFNPLPLHFIGPLVIQTLCMIRRS